MRSANTGGAGLSIGLIGAETTIRWSCLYRRSGCFRRPSLLWLLVCPATSHVNIRDRDKLGIHQRPFLTLDLDPMLGTVRELAWNGTEDTLSFNGYKGSMSGSFECLLRPDDPHRGKMR